MEDTLRDSELDFTYHIVGLNPCFNGRYSQSGGFTKFSNGRESEWRRLGGEQS